MTVEELINQLKQLPPSMEVYYEGGEYKDDWRPVYRVEIQKFSSLSSPAGVHLS